MYPAATGAVMRRPSRISRRVGLAGTGRFTVRGSLGMGAIVAREAVGVRAGGALRDDLHALVAGAFHEVGRSLVTDLSHSFKTGNSPRAINRPVEISFLSPRNIPSALPIKKQDQEPS